MRRAIWHALSTDNEFTSLLPSERLYRAGSYGVDPLSPPVDPEVGPFGFISYSVHTPIRGQLTSRNLTLDVHDRYGSYSRIEAILKSARRLFRELSYPVVDDAFTAWLNSATWNGDGPDNWDTGWGTLTKSSTFTVVGSGEE